MNHQEWKEKISAFLDGELPPAERAAVERHRNTCAECDAMARNWGALSQTFFTAPAEINSEEFVQKVMARVPGGMLAAAVWGGWKRWAWAAAAAGMLAMAFPFESLMTSTPTTERLLLEDSNDSPAMNGFFSGEDSSTGELLGLNWDAS